MLRLTSENYLVQLMQKRETSTAHHPIAMLLANPVHHFVHPRSGRHFLHFVTELLLECACHFRSVAFTNPLRTYKRCAIINVNNPTPIYHILYIVGSQGIINKLFYFVYIHSNTVCCEFLGYPAVAGSIVTL